jgi:uncharacterized protein YndB with AHSA1/START domain
MKMPAWSWGIWSVVALVSPVTAEVRETKESAFTIESTATSPGDPSHVYAALGKIGAWWDPQHTWSGSAKNLSIQLQAGSCFCEKLPGGGSVEHGRVIYAQPGVTLRLDAPLGPLQDMAVVGVLTFKLAPQAGGTLITLTYRVSGALRMESEKLAPIVDQVLRTQLDRLAAYASTETSRK